MTYKGPKDIVSKKLDCNGATQPVSRVSTPLTAEMLLCSISYSKVHGDCEGIPVGLMFADRQDLYDSGLHGRTRAGIFGTKADDGAFSIVLNEGYEDDEDQGETM